MTAERIDGIDVVHTLEPGRIGQLLDLYAGAWWADHRTAAEVARMLASTDLVFGLIDRASDRLVAFARVLTDFTYRAVLFDVIVAPDRRARGLGRLLLEAVLEHPGLAGIEDIELTCRPELIPFYRRCGFTDAVGESRLMRRSSHPGLSG